jgi:hypothetical protein
MILPYELPHACESAEVAGLLARLKPTARRALRSYVSQVAFGKLRVGEWLAAPTCPVRERRWRYLLAEPAFAAALAAYTAAMQRWELAAEQKAVAGSQRTLRLAAERSAARLVEQADGHVGQFFAVRERWTAEPRPTAEVLAEEVRADGDGPQRRFFRVRELVFDATSLTDPQRARLIKKFSDSPRAGLSVELYDAQRASESILDRAAAETASKGPAGPVRLQVIYDDGPGDVSDSAAAAASEAA